jgi:hypothetical protein
MHGPYICLCSGRTSFLFSQHSMLHDSILTSSWGYSTARDNECGWKANDHALSPG